VIEISLHAKKLYLTIKLRGRHNSEALWSYSNDYMARVGQGTNAIHENGCLRAVFIGEFGLVRCNRRSSSL